MIQAKAPLQSDGVKYVEIPKGWRRILENGSIHYISPSSSYLKSYENIIDYLKKDGTCKCGLDCPFHVHRVFNFDTSVQNKEQKDNLINSESHSSTCKLCDSNWQNGKSFVDSRLLQKPINQTLKPTAKKPQQFSFDSSLNKKVVNRSRAKLSDGPKAKKPRKVSSPLSDIPSPPPIPISSPVQNVPNNLGALNQGPLPSFASIVSSSKFFNPGPNRGPLHPTGSVPLQGNNNFSFPRILTSDISKSVTATSSNTGVVNIMTSSAAFTSMATGYTTASSTIMTKSAAAKSAATKPATEKTASENAAGVTNTAVTSSLVPNTIGTTVSVVQNTTAQSDKKSTEMDTSASSLLMATSQSTSISCSALPNVASNAVCLVKTIPTPTITNNKTVIMPIINTPTLPSVFAPLDGVPTIDTVKTKPPPKPKRSRPSRAKPKPKPEMKLDDKSKMVKVAGSTPAMMSSGISTHSVPSHWPMTISHVPYQTPSTTVVSAVNSTSSVASSHTADNLSRPAVPQQVAMTSPIYMTTNHSQKQGQTMQISSPPVPNLQIAQPPLNPSNSVGSDSTTSAPGVTPTNTYSVVATPRIQAPPGMMYVAAAPGVGMFSPTYPYTTGTPQLQITQASVSQQNKTALTTTPVVTTSQQTVTQGMTTESAQGKISFQVPGMYVQGTAANQMFPVNSQGFGVNQYKVPYQLQNAIYPNTGNAMTFITPNGAKTTYPGLQTVATGNIGQFAYPNPYMFGIVMPTTTTQQSTSSSTSSTPGTPTSVTTSLHMIQPQSIQNPAVAAAFESFVPIAPAAAGATPRFAQTLAHLASAYNTFPQAGLVQGTNHLQLAYQMMQMNPHGNGQQIANLGGLGTADAVSKHPTTSLAKQGSSDSAKGSSNTKSKASSNSPASNSPSTPVIQDHGGPFASLNTTTTPSLTPSSLCTSTTTSAFQPQVVISALGHSQQIQEKLTDCPSESKNTKMITPDQQSMDNDSETDSEWKANSLCSVGAKQATNGPTNTDQSESLSPSHNISPLSKQKNITLSEIDASKPSSETESQKYHQQAVNANKSPLRTASVFEQNTVHPIENSGQANSHYSKQEFQSYQSALETKAPTNTIDNREPMKSPNFVDKVNYYETNPLLGMKRSCEAIEVYPDPPEHLDEEDKEDFYSSNGESPEGNEATSECTLDRRHGDSSSIKEPFKAGAIQNVAKGLHNGGCNAAHSEQDTFHGSSVKPTIAAEPYQADVFGNLPIPNVRPHFDIGDIVWAQARGLPSWPGKIVDENKVGKGKADDGKKWVMWFGDHTFSQVEVDRLKTLNEGLRSLDDKTRKKKYRAKKTRISLEQAITEALEELEMREQLKARQGVRSKGKKKRLR